MSWQVAITVDPERREPVFQQIAAAIVGDVRKGRLRPGDRLPGSRSLADQLGVHRNTVNAAFDELTAQGWIRAEHGRGCFVSEALPDTAPSAFADRRAGVPERAGFALAAAPAGSPVDWMMRPFPPGMIAMAGGVPDMRLAPVAELARAYRRALQRPGARVLDYGDARGHPALRAALADMLNALRGLAAEPDDVLVLRGSQMALYLSARAIVRAGDTVVVESLGYGPAWDAFHAAGARVVGVSVDGDGLRVDKLEKLLQRTRVRAVYVTPHHHYPTLAALSAPRRLRLLELARKHRFAIVEDDYDHEVHYRGRPILPLASADRAGVVVYLGTLSKVLAPGVRVGYVVAPRAVLERMTALRRMVDRQGDPAVERAVAELLEDGVVQRHARRMRRVYHARRDALLEAMRDRLGERLVAPVPDGGMALWARAAPGVDIDAWSQRAARAGVLFPTARSFALDRKPRPFARLPYAPLDERELREAVARMASCADA